ncbi:MAG: DUF1493 family protein [Asticcacaulis sp.]
MKTPELSELCDLIEESCGLRPETDPEIDPEADLLEELEIWGDDVHALLADFARRYDVDMSGYLGYFHTGEEGGGIGNLFVKTPHDRVPYIPITLSLLQEAARLKRWPIDYPPHTLPRYRWDTIITWLFTGGLLLWLISGLLWKLLAG